MLFLKDLSSNSELKQRNMFSMIAATAALFASFIGLCGLTRTLGVLRYFFPNSSPIYTIQVVVLVCCAIVSTITAIVSYKLLPVMFQVMENFELNSDGNVQHIEKYLVDIVEMMKESVIVLSEGFKVLRCNEASKNLFHRPSLVGCDIVELLHPEDIRALEVAVLQAREMYSQTPVTVEYRVRRGSAAGLAAPPQPPSPSSPLTSCKKQPSGRSALLGSPKNRFAASSGKIYAVGNLPVPEKSSFSLTYSSTVASVQTPRKPDPPSSAPNPSDEYTWVESTICRGMRFNQTDQSECDFRMVSRCIDHRKRRAEDEYQDMLRASAEQARINAAKLRYISCIAHDLKTPLQSFCFSLDLLGQTMLIPEQRECIQQANVAVDLMKLTISQTMDISKALSGAKLVPRCATVTLSTVLSRVKVIM
jgi:PAS domain-containing protein